MKNTLDAYERYLSTYLTRNNFPEAEDASFITARADNAYDVFCDARLKGLDTTTAQELAMLTLMQGFEGESFDDIVREILSEYCPEEAFDFFIADMDELLAEPRERFVPGEIIPETAEYEAFKTGLLGIIDEYFTTYFPENYGL